MVSTSRLGRTTQRSFVAILHEVQDSTEGYGPSVCEGAPKGRSDTVAISRSPTEVSAQPRLWVTAPKRLARVIDPRFDAMYPEALRHTLDHPGEALGEFCFAFGAGNGGGPK